MAFKVAKIAVSDAIYSIDKPYDYLIPETLEDKAVPGARVFVPFSRGNRRSEGIILSVSDKSEYETLKAITQVLDDEPVLTQEQLQLAYFMRDRFFCTVYSAVKAMLPAGLWFRDDGAKRVNDAECEMARLAVDAEEASVTADNKRLKAPNQSAILDMLCSFEALPVKELLTFSGAKRQSLKALVNAELVELYKKEVFRRPARYYGETEPLPVLNAAQQKAYEGIAAAARSGKASAALLYGVTGSGKTSVYVHLIRDMLEGGKSAILLVPEIALTPQMIETFSSYFGDKVAVLHSSLSPGERYDEWKRIKSGRARLVIGTRSAIFAPVKDLGIIIIDEEQEETYRSENNPRYNARDVAKFRCTKAGCLLLLGSATPDIVSRYNASIGRYALFELRGRYNRQELPNVRIVDMKKELRSGNSGNISSVLRDELRENIERGEQSILFLNRRGANKLISCGECGYVYKCPRCSVALTYHSDNNRLLCHYCGYSRRVDDSCPECGGMLRRIGAGTQKIEEELGELFPGVPVLRMDTDSVLPAGSHEKLFEKFREEKIPIMVGTQMVTKGLNFENVTLVGVISADQSLYSSNYRAGERTFSLITQVVGRSGRGSKPGRAIIQTFTPANETIIQAAAQDYDAFFESELELRKIQSSPPFCTFYSITASGLDKTEVFMACKAMIELVRRDTCNEPSAAVYGPTPLPVMKVNNRYRFRLFLCCSDSPRMRAVISQTVIAFSKDKRFKGISVYADTDPVD